MSKHPKAPVQVTSTAARPWKYVEGERPHQVIVEERQDRKNRLMLRWWQPASRSTGAGDVEEARASGQWKKVFLANPHPRSVRTAEQAVDRAAEIRARQVALTVYLALLEGRDPMGVLSPLTEVPGRVQADAAMTPTVIPAPRPVHGLAVSREAPSTFVADAPSPARSIRDGITLAFPTPQAGQLTVGLYLGDTRHAREARAAALVACSMVEAMFQPHCTWSVLSPSKWLELGVRLLERKTPMCEAHPSAPGVRSMELAVAELAACARWLLKEGHLSQVTQPPLKWRSTLRHHFTMQTNLSLEPERPRHTPEEAGRLYRAALDLTNACDPRVRLLMRLGLELRAGQVLRVRRSALKLDTSGAFGHGTLRVLGAGKKHGVTLDLTPEDREAIDWAVEGYLANLEKAYLCRELPDYYLIPAYRLKRGVAAVRPFRQLKPLARRQALKLFRELEGIAGVVSQPGRGWYGLRRVGSDLVEAVTQDEGVRNAIGGWTGGTRRGVYLEPNSPVVKERVAQARRQVRDRLSKGNSAPNVPKNVPSTSPTPKTLGT